MQTISNCILIGVNDTCTFVVLCHSKQSSAIHCCTISLHHVAHWAHLLAYFHLTFFVQSQNHCDNNFCLRTNVLFMSSKLCAWMTVICWLLYVRYIYVVGNRCGFPQVKWRDGAAAAISIYVHGWKSEENVKQNKLITRRIHTHTIQTVCQFNIWERRINAI